MNTTTHTHKHEDDQSYSCFHTFTHLRFTAESDMFIRRYLLYINSDCMKRNFWMLEKVNVMSKVPKWPTFNLKSDPLKGTRECHKHINTHSQITELIILHSWSCMNQCCESISISMAATSDKKWRSGWLWRNTITLFAFVPFWWLSLPLNLSLCLRRHGKKTFWSIQFTPLWLLSAF